MSASAASRSEASGAVSRWQQGWWRGARAVASPNFGLRPAGTVVDLVVLHSISLPPGRFSGNAVEQLFTNRLDWDAHPYFRSIRGLQVSAHFFVRRRGGVIQFVSCEDRAWHAGQSAWCGRANCNDYSIGIELEGLEGGVFTAAQYAALTRLLRALRLCYSIAQVVGHEHIAPGRKIDPGPGFDWARLAQLLAWPSAFWPMTAAAALASGAHAAKR